jgi:hypothetical protein
MKCMRWTTGMIDASRATSSRAGTLGPNYVHADLAVIDTLYRHRPLPCNHRAHTTDKV